ncbi:MAG TPA: hypothetical protein VG223_14160 [Solirubrobacteraceae bacterium]|nr:hypothetical protein [Solirubrobacteraceae bacterium]
MRRLLLCSPIALALIVAGLIVASSGDAAPAHRVAPLQQALNQQVKRLTSQMNRARGVPHLCYAGLPDCSQTGCTSYATSPAPLAVVLNHSIAPARVGAARSITPRACITAPSVTRPVLIDLNGR